MKKSAKLWKRLAKKSLQAEREDEKDSYSNLENAEPELCVKLLEFPSVHNFLGLRKKIKNSSKSWIQEFLEKGGLTQLLITLERLSEKSQQSSKIDFVTETELLECVTCLRAIMMTTTGLEFVISYNQCSTMLAKTLCNKNTTVKLEVFNLLSAMTMYSRSGKLTAIGVIEECKKLKSLRYRFSLVINELKLSKNYFYTTALLRFVNALMRSTKTLQHRRQIRNEFIGLQLLDLLSELSHSSSKELLDQIHVFESNKLKDEESLSALAANQYEGIDIDDTRELFLALFNKVCNTPHENYLLSILQSLFQLNSEDPASDLAWRILEKTAQRVTLIDSVDEGVKLLESQQHHLPASNLIIQSKKDHESGSNEMVKFAGTMDEVDGLTTAADHVDGFLDNVSTSLDHVNDVAHAGPTLAGKFLLGFADEDSSSSESSSESSFSAESTSESSVSSDEDVVDAPPPQNSVQSDSVPMMPPPPPPPPPPPNAASLPSKPKRRCADVPQPQNNLKKLNWKKLPNFTLEKNLDNIWGSLEEMAADVEPDYEALDELFAKPDTSKTNDEEKQCPQEIVSFVESRRSMNIGIFLKQFGKSNEEITKALLEGNEKWLTQQKLKMMSKYLPETHEINSLLEYPGDKSLLSNVDRYFLMLSNVPDYELRIEIGLANTGLDEKLNDFCPPIQSYKQACNEILQSETLKKLFLLILKTGNFLNYGSYTGNVFGFSIQSLTNLADTKSDPKFSVLNCIVEKAEKSYPEILELSNEFSCVVECNGLSLPELIAGVNAFISSTQNLEKKIQNASKDILEQSEGFLKKALPSVASLKSDLEELDALSVRVSTYLAEDESKFELDECISTLAKFLHQVDEARKQNKKRAREEKAKQRNKKNTLSFQRPKQKTTADQSNDMIKVLLDEIKSF